MALTANNTYNTIINETPVIPTIVEITENIEGNLDVKLSDNTVVKYNAGSDERKFKAALRNAFAGLTLGEFTVI